MKKKPFREHHLLRLLASYEQQALPFDVVINRYFRTHTALGAKDRAFIAETAYGLMRWRGWLDWQCQEPYCWERRLACYSATPLPSFVQRATQRGRDSPPPDHIAVSFPKQLFERIVASLGVEKALRVCYVSNSVAPTTVRVNGLKIERAKLFHHWLSQSYPVKLCSFSPYGITFLRRLNLFGLPEFKQGLFEVQDEGSQLVALLVGAQRGDLVLDFCAGSGGKTLAFAPLMHNHGQIFLHDIRPWVLEEAEHRLRRAGVQNSQIALPDSNKLQGLQGKMDWVLVDAPCSGTGTLRRNPDMKWKFSIEMLERLVEQQRAIVQQACIYLKPGGTLVYATCSVLKEENEQQVDYFVRNFSLDLKASFGVSALCDIVVDRTLQPIRALTETGSKAELKGGCFTSIPEEGEMDGFFAARFTRFTRPI